jgi:hypothetical protein
LLIICHLHGWLAGGGPRSGCWPRPAPYGWHGSDAPAGRLDWEAASSTHLADPQAAGAWPCGERAKGGSPARRRKGRRRCCSNPGLRAVQRGLGACSGAARSAKHAGTGCWGRGSGARRQLQQQRAHLMASSACISCTRRAGRRGPCSRSELMASLALSCRPRAVSRARRMPTLSSCGASMLP